MQVGGKIFLRMWQKKRNFARRMRKQHLHSFSARLGSRLQQAATIASLWLLCADLQGANSIGYAALGDSLRAFASQYLRTIPVPKPDKQISDSSCHEATYPLASPPVRIKNLRVNGKRVQLVTNSTLSYLSLTADEQTALKRKISLWILGHENGNILLYTDGHEISELAKPEKLKAGSESNLQGKRIALWGSHGIYLDTIQQRWHWQRATLWTTVEDLYSSQYTRLLTQMLENAGAEVLQPRGQIGDSAAMTIGPSGYPRWAESARSWLEYIGVPDSVWRDTHKRLPRCKPNEKDDFYKDDIRCRPFWVNWLLDTGTKIDACVAVHTDGALLPSDTIKTGTLVIYSERDTRGKDQLRDGRSRMANRWFADQVQTQIVQDIRRSLTADWPRRELKNAGYFEAKESEVPTVLLELLSHQSMADMQWGLDPKFQFVVARAIYKGIGRWLEGEAFIPTPLTPHSLRLREAKGKGVNFSWQAATDSLEAKAKPTEYLVQVQRGEETIWQEVWKGKKTSTIIPMERGQIYRFRVIALNAGGKSLPSETLCAYLAPDEAAPTELVVNAFYTVRGPQWFSDSIYAGIVPGSYAIPDGIDYSYIGQVNDFRRESQWISDEICGWGNCYRDCACMGFVGNTHDYPTRYAETIIRKGHSFVSANITALMGLQQWDDAYAYVYIIGGKEGDGPVMVPFPTSVPMTISGSHEGSIPRACHSGVILTDDGQRLRFATSPNAETLCAEEVSAFVPTKNEVVRARYLDTGLPACVEDTVTHVTRWGVPLEAIVR